MKPVHGVRSLGLLAPILGMLLFVDLATAQAPPSLPSETPAQFTPVTDSFDYTRRDVMIPMRDGVKLHTVVLVPKGAKNAAILLTRTPYSATALTTNMQSSHLASSLYGYDNATDVIVNGGYIPATPGRRGESGSPGDDILKPPPPRP